MAEPMKPYEQNIVTFRMMLRGLDEALERLQAAVQQRDSAGHSLHCSSHSTGLFLSMTVSEHTGRLGARLSLRNGEMRCRPLQ